MHYLFTQIDIQWDLQDNHGDTALHVGCVHRHFFLIDYLLRKKVGFL